ncbi:MAG: protein-L-isoaspartate(D-aspartate) O-methyltransferase [Candidatus Marinimicrobia bacterium]|nr:protein-L-isoaspartate(D-aspartate) O-methyltransferase [Candidatus Neomarinimicrobiota bacterium]MDP6594081.1 protein-L-isoaspartate(D-aspartate) O-methyltransferase [Candidatus Neomarinimicrobiota bacterium]MDP6837277.1 protein-L-isoaspartate(D-aspartate) O-methyltransferase [Candidatus Neomarinimicrobiota bacterium]MDP6966843.1 protein-L-isoaspartate(D-aspartate) O-methyltransferase [Candidatus Neomarinimicrobiota bacterium]|tara:strand:- start:136 stop:870 length:735 start_codon:yes stop_codon:yes gene_type:complete
MRSPSLIKFLGLILLLGIPAGITPQISGGDNFGKERETMIKTQIEARGVKDVRVLESMKAVPRHLFIGESLWPMAYSDGPLPIGYGQTISQPYIVALMTELLQPDTHHVVLEIGTGSGYQAAVLAKLVHWVYTIEIVPELGQSAKKTLKRLGYDNVAVRVDDGYQGWPEEAPFDRIVVTAAPEEIPPRLVEQLKAGGRMILPVGPQWWGQDLLIVEKDEEGNVSTKESIPVRFVPMVHEKERKN